MTTPDRARASDVQPKLIRFGVFELDRRSGELRRKGAKIRLQEQPFQVLSLLVERSGEVVTREELRDKLWPADTFVDFDHGLNAAIKRLRDALGESAEAPVFIETLPRRGYRFLCPVVVCDRPLLQTWAESVRLGAQRHPAFYLSLISIITVLLGTGIYLAQRRWRARLAASGSYPLAAAMKVVPLTTYPGAELDPAFSPNGKQVAFVRWDGNPKGDGDVYLKLVGGDQPARVTHGSGFACCAAWSNDSRYIAYLRCDGDDPGLRLVPALGGPERKISFFSCMGISWSPDGSLIAVTRKDRDDSPWAIFFLRMQDFEFQRATTPPEAVIGDRYPAFSPDGKILAFVRASSPWVADLWVAPVGSQFARQLTFDHTEITGIAWSSDGHSLIFSSHRAGGKSLWKVSVDGGPPEAVPLAGPFAEKPAVALQGHRLAYTQGFLHPSIWEMTLEGGRIAGVPHELLHSGVGEGGPQYSPDGKWLAYYSSLSGNTEIWMCNADGSDPMQLTSLGVLSGTPRWSPDGKFIAFDSRPSGHSHIFTLATRGGEARPATSGQFEDAVPSWSRDGKWIYFASNRTGSWQIWKVSAADGTLAQVTKDGGFGAFESLDGKQLYFVKESELGLWQKSLASGEEKKILKQNVNWGHWAVGRDGIYFVDVAGQKPTIGFWRYANNKVSRIATLEKAVPPGEPAFDVSPDGRRVVFLQIHSEVDIMMIENFQ